MESQIEPRIVLLLGFEDANSLISGILNLKGCKVYKSATTEDCLNLLNQLEGQVDAILVKKEIAINNNFMLLNSPSGLPTPIIWGHRRMDGINPCLLLVKDYYLYHWLVFLQHSSAPLLVK